MLNRLAVPITVLDTADNGSFDLGNISGYLRAIQLEAGNATGTVTHTVALLDNNDVVVWSKASLADNADSFALVEGSGDEINVPVVSSSQNPWSIKLTQSGAQSGADVAHTVVLFIEEV